MANSKEAGKGGGARKYGQNKRQPSKMHYAERMARGVTPKARRIFSALTRGQAQPGWSLVPGTKGGTQVVRVK